MTSEPPREPERGNTPSTQTDPAQVSTERATYNVVSDTITGINIRKDDNKLQAIIILVSVLLFATITALLALISPSWNLPWYGGAVLGAFAGLVIGFFTSGLFLMIYLALRHMQGKHDRRLRIGCSLSYIWQIEFAKFVSIMHFYLSGPLKRYRER